MVNDSQKRRLEQAANEWGKEYKSPVDQIGDYLSETAETPDVHSDISDGKSKPRTISNLDTAAEVTALQVVVAHLTAMTVEVCAKTSNRKAEDVHRGMREQCLANVANFTAHGYQNGDLTIELRHKLSERLTAIFDASQTAMVVIDAVEESKIVEKAS